MGIGFLISINVVKKIVLIAHTKSTFVLKGYYYFNILLFSGV